MLPAQYEYKARTPRHARTEDDAHAGGVELRAARAAHHLQHVRDGEVHVALAGAVVELGALDDHQVRGQVHAPGERGGADEDVDLTREE